ncbi:hypothetical protein CAPTEDRAFT_99387, partial [Capitella teleta]
VLKCISKAGLKFNEYKCQFGQQELTFFGHTILQFGYWPHKKRYRLLWICQFQRA